MNTFSIRGVLKEANALMVNRRWMMIKQYLVIAVVLQLLLMVLFGRGALIGAMLGIFLTTKWSLAYVRKGTFSYNDLFENITLKNVVYFICATALVFLSIFGGLLLLIIPGIIFSVRLSLTKFVAIEKNLTPLMALKESKRITKGNRWKLFFFFITLAAINVIGVLCLIVGVFFTAPLSMLALALAYKKLSEPAVEIAA